VRFHLHDVCQSSLYHLRHSYEHAHIYKDSISTNVLIENFSPSFILLRVIKWAHNLAHKNVPRMQFKQWMQCMQCEFFSGNLVLVDSKRVGPPSRTTLTQGSDFWLRGISVRANEIKEIFGVCLVSITREHKREIRESERLKRKFLNSLQIMTW
jgi:hypothetical protein